VVGTDLESGDMRTGALNLKAGAEGVLQAVAEAEAAAGMKTAMQRAEKAMRTARASDGASAEAKLQVRYAS